MTTKRSRSRGVLRTSRVAKVAGGVLFVVAAAAACQSNNIPSSYGDVTKASFMGTCTGSGVSAADGTTTSIAPTAVCQCSYDVFVSQVPFDDKAAEDAKFNQYKQSPYHPTFNQLNTDLKEDPTKINQLPDSVQSALKTCTTTQEIVTPGSTPGSTPAGSAGSTPPGTTAGGSTTAGSTPGAGSTPRT